MFGYLRARNQELSYREQTVLDRYYCGLCKALRKDFGMPCAVLTNWDARFLALLVGAQEEVVSLYDKTLCPVTLGTMSQSAVGYGAGTRYAAAVTLLLLEEKLADRVRDDRSLLAKHAGDILDRKFQDARHMLDKLEFPLVQLEHIRYAQRVVESEYMSLDLQSVTQPSAEAISLFLGHTAIVGKMQVNIGQLSAIGACLGRVVTLLDACEDYDVDASKSRFNAIASTFDSEAPVLPLSRKDFERVRSYLLSQLQTIRQLAGGLLLRRHEAVIRNILYFGLYDAVKRITARLAQFVMSESRECRLTWHCASCEKDVDSRFCPTCGANECSVRGE